MHGFFKHTHIFIQERAFFAKCELVKVLRVHFPGLVTQSFKIGWQEANLSIAQMRRYGCRVRSNLRNGSGWSGLALGGSN